jgi:pimeloyl-[acyl-carrier protein] methyl ester esterase
MLVPLNATSVAQRPQLAPVRWLLLRGLGRERRHWFDFPEALAAGLGVEYRAIDLPGMGARCRESALRSISEAALDVRGQLAAHESPGPWGVLGISLGGMVAVSLASMWPSGVSHVVVINSSSRSALIHQRLRPSALAQLARAALARNVDDRERRIYALTTNASEPQIALWAARSAALGREAPAAGAALVRQLLAAASFRAPPLTQPALVLSAESDRLVSPECSRQLARELGATYRSHPSAGHDLPLEDPDWVIAQIRAWLASKAFMCD